MELFEYLQDKLTPSELKIAPDLYKNETTVFLETLERFRKYFMEELKVMRNDISINGFGENND